MTTNSGSSYVPGPWPDWQRRDPAEVGLDGERLAEAVAYAQEHETPWPTDLESYIPHMLDPEPHNEVIGPTRPRGGPNGLIVRHGAVVAEWGDPRRVDMTFSVAKSYLSTMAGLAFDRRLIRDVHDLVRDYVDDGGFDSPHNARITWQHLLQQTSEWTGTLWDKPHWADRQTSDAPDEERPAPGELWTYNDVRVNRLALALLRVWRKPLPQVLREEIFNPIGASPTWQWHGYRNSWVTIDGLRAQSVSGGGHWGGGVWASSWDHARFGYLFLRRGRWGERQLISERWIELATTPCPVKPEYGYMWWLNTDRLLYPSAPPTSFFALGAGQNTIWIDPDLDLLVVARWMDKEAVDGLLAKVMAALR
jgi:CubicO group peptidase (beta-lactamase class C family)